MLIFFREQTNYEQIGLGEGKIVLSHETADELMYSRFTLID